MSEKTAIRMGAALTLAVGWAVAAWLLWRTSVPSLHLSGLDEHRFFTSAQLRRASHYSLGEDVLFLAGTVARLLALLVLVRVVPRSVRGMGLGRIAASVVVGMVLLTTIWAVGLPFSLADLWWQHHWGLGPFSVFSWLDAQWSGLGSEAVSALLTIVLVVGTAGRFRRWWLISGAAFVAIAALFAFVGGYQGAAGTKPLRNAQLRADVTRFEAEEHVRGTPVRVQDVSSYTNQVNAFTSGFGPAARVVLWNTLLDGRFTRGEEDAVIAHELGHVRSRHIIKAIGWTALLVLPALLLLGRVLRARGGLGRPENLPLAFLVLSLLVLVATPFENAVSRRYEAEADWRSLNATHDPAATTKLFEDFRTTSLEDPDPPLLDYVWLENHPTLMQRIAMAQDYARRAGR